MTNLSRGTPYTLTGTDELDFSTSNADIRIGWKGLAGSLELYSTIADPDDATQKVEFLERTYTDAQRVITILATNTDNQYRIKYSGGAGGKLVMN